MSSRLEANVLEIAGKLDEVSNELGAVATALDSQTVAMENILRELTNALEGLNFER